MTTRTFRFKWFNTTNEADQMEIELEPAEKIVAWAPMLRFSGHNYIIVVIEIGGEEEII